MSSDIKITSQIARCSDEILMCLVSAQDPVKAIVRRYDEAPDKDIFIAAMAATLLLRHRQWQAAGSKNN